MSRSASIRIAVSRGGLCLALGFLIGTLNGIAEESASDGVAFFEKKIRPVFAENCYKCHSSQSEKLKGRLLLDSRDGVLKGGETGPAVVPGDPEKSLLIRAVRYTDKELQMPPKDKKLSERQIADLVAWVKMGAPWAAEEKSSLARNKTGFEITEKDRAYWAFQPIKRPARPSVKKKDWVANGIDAFVLANLESKGLKPNPPAARRELARRTFFDLIGLPPTAEQVAGFEKDKSPNAYEKLIDYLLALPQYGERWGRHWLDVARFAQSNGYERDSEKPLAWRYRDYVVKAFNEDKPYDLFIKEQIAGDELSDASADSVVATGFQRLCVWDDEPDDKRMAEFDELDDIVSTTSAAFLGLTMGCARCHDHKFDPISQTDYYQFLSFFRNVRPYEAPKYTHDSANYVPFAEPSKARAWRREQEAKIKALEKEVESAQDAGEKKKLGERLKKIKEESGPFEWALAVRERGAKAIPTQVLVRGNAASPGAEIEPAFLTVLGARKPVLSEAGPGSQSSGRRLALAEWIASPVNPLTARVMVNRIWQHHFGRGIVRTTTDFGRAGTPPTNPKLLDWLGVEFIESGWSLKKMHKMILLSSAYRMSSRAENSKAMEIDPDNDLLWRQNLRRLEAESIRDSILSVSGGLNLKMGGRGFFPHLGGEVLAGGSRPGLDWQNSPAAERARRSVYTYIRRTMLVPALEAFDYSNTTSPLGERPVTTVAPQALMLLNDEFMQEQAAVFAAKLMAESGDVLEKQVRRAYQRVVGREPSRRELQMSLDFMKRQAEEFQGIAGRVVFRPDVPGSLALQYIDQLKAPDYLVGPRQSWSYYRGRWSAPYEGGRTVERQRGPFALWQCEPFANGVVEAKLAVDRASEFGSLLVRASTEGDEQRGYEVTLDPRQQRIALLRHGKELTTLAVAEVVIPTIKPVALRIEMADARVRVWVDGARQPVIDSFDSHPISAKGLVGVRAWGAPMCLDKLSVAADGKHFEAAAAQTDNEGVRRRALQSFCLLLLNLNEMIYVD